jgi:hypothetical protein
MSLLLQAKTIKSVLAESKKKAFDDRVLFGKVRKINVDCCECDIDDRVLLF